MKNTECLGVLINIWSVVKVHFRFLKHSERALVFINVYMNIICIYISNVNFAMKVPQDCSSDFFFVIELFRISRKFGTCIKTVALLT